MEKLETTLWKEGYIDGLTFDEPSVSNKQLCKAFPEWNHQTAKRMIAARKNGFKVGQRHRREGK